MHTSKSLVSFEFSVPNLSDGNAYSALSRFQRPLPFCLPLRHHVTNCSQRKRRQAGPSPSFVSCSSGLQSPGSGLAGENTVGGVRGIPVCLEEAGAGCGLMASGSKCTNGCVLLFVQTVGVTIYGLYFRHYSVRWAPR